MFQTKAVEKIITHILCSVFFVLFRKSCSLSCEKNRARHATDDNMTHAHCMLDTKGYKHTHTHTHTHTLRMCNNLCFSTATVVARTRPSVTFIRTLPVLLLDKYGDLRPKSSTVKIYSSIKLDRPFFGKDRTIKF